MLKFRKFTAEVRYFIQSNKKTPANYYHKYLHEQNQEHLVL